MIRLAFSTNAFKRNTLAEAVDAIADAGYAGVEVMADVPHAHPATFSPGDRAALRRQLADRGLAVSNVNAFTHFADGDTYHPTWIAGDGARRRVRVDHTVGAIELAAELGTATVSVQPGGPLIGTGLSRAEASRRFADGLSAVLPAARRLGVTIAVEPEPGLLIETAAEYAAFKAEHFPSEPLVRMNCDVGHLFCVGDSPADVIRGQADQVRPRPPGGHRQEPRPPAPAARPRGDRLPGRLRGVGVDRLRRLDDRRAVPVRGHGRRDGPAGDEAPAADDRVASGNDRRQT